FSSFLFDTYKSSINSVCFSTFKPYQKTDVYWTWRVPRTEYKGLHIIGVYRGVFDISGALLHKGLKG
ncbi:hypothetical protein R5B80_18595, partial [Acinetobacter baumannii]|nr:hypothetical protein [Acinetobacter baumannii]